MYKYGFVVLNFINFTDSIKCVRSIQNIAREDYFIAIIDNCSPNNSFSILRDEYLNNENLAVLRSDRNGGYSYGNNIGINYLLSKEINCIILATSDTEIINHSILEVLDEYYNSERIGIIGPAIKGPHNENQNPCFQTINFLYILNLYFYPWFSNIRKIIYSLFPVIKRKRFNNYLSNDFSESKKQFPVYMVHGSFLIFLKSYLSKYNHLDSNIFMYGEEDIISYNCLNAKLDILFEPRIEVLHKDSLSSKLFFEDYNATREQYIRKSKKYLSNLISPKILFRAFFKKEIL